jgi:hypothetical protein
MRGRVAFGAPHHSPTVLIARAQRPPLRRSRLLNCAAFMMLSFPFRCLVIRFVTTAIPLAATDSVYRRAHQRDEAVQRRNRINAKRRQRFQIVDVCTGLKRRDRSVVRRHEWDCLDPFMPMKRMPVAIAPILKYS